MRNRLVTKSFLVAGSVGLPLLWFACNSTSSSSETAAGPAAAVPTRAQVAKMTPKELEAGFKTTLQPFVQTYCVSCHGSKDPEAELDLSKFTTFASVTKNASRWHEVMERVKAGEMPPDDAEKLPTAAQKKPVIAWLESMHAAEVARTAGDPGTVLARRLSNAEYDYTIRDLTGADIRPTKEFPVDPANTAGFDNSGESLAMSPSMVQKYLEAARAVANSAVFTPYGIEFAEFTTQTREDREKFAVQRLVKFYASVGKSLETRQTQMMGQTLDYADYLMAAWRFQHRVALGRPQATLADLAQEGKISPKYLQTLWGTLTTPAGQTGPLAALQTRWKALPAPTAGHEPAELRKQTEATRDFIIEVRGLVRMQFANLIPNDRIIAAGSPTMVYWKNRQYEANRANYAGNATKVDFTKFKDSDPALMAPTAEAALPAYEEEFKRFSAVFPDTFFVMYRSRMFLANNSREITTDLGGRRLFTAGTHSGMGFFRDDRPLYDLVLDDAQKKQLDRLWNELEVLAEVPAEEYRQFLWFERGEPPSVMIAPMFAEFRAEDNATLTEAKIKQLADVYAKRVETVKVFISTAPRGGRGGGAGGQAAAAAGRGAGPAPAGGAAVAVNAPGRTEGTPAPAPARADGVPAAPAPATSPAPSPAPAAPPSLAVNTALNYIAPDANTPSGPAPEGMVEFKLSPEAVQATRDYFAYMNKRIRAAEQMARDAEPLQVKALVAFAERAARHPFNQAEKDDILGFYQKLRGEKLSHEDAIRDCIVSVLMAPTFNFRAEVARTNDKAIKNGVQPLSDIELANRLSYFLWSSMPDAELMAHATKGDLHDPQVLAAQARRMVRDDRINAFAKEFGANWLDVRRFEEHNAVDRERFPTFTNDLREAMFQEPVHFITDLVQRNGSILDFIYGDYTFVNGVLAKHYGMPEPAQADAWVRVDNAGKYQRGGLLPMSVFLTKNAPGLRTSPVKRGHWVVTKILGERIPAPPPNVPAIPPDESKLGGLTLRETLAKHREDKTCATCHNKFDSMGLVFEGYGPVGETRELDLAGKPTQIGAQFPDGVERSGLPGLKTYIKDKTQPEFVENLSKKLLAYALGRTLIPSDDLVVEQMTRKLAADGYRFDNLVTEIVTSRQFLNKRITPDNDSLSAQ